MAWCAVVPIVQKALVAHEASYNSSYLTITGTPSDKGERTDLQFTVL